MLKGIVSPPVLVGNFMASAEYALKYGNPSDAEFVRLLYRYILLREASANEVNFHVRSLEGGLSRVSLAMNFLNTTEFRTGTQARLNAFLVYASFLMRGPTSTEHSGRAAQLQSGRSINEVIGDLLGSEEFTRILR
jgi:hypothetical protein